MLHKVAIVVPLYWPHLIIFPLTLGNESGGHGHGSAPPLLTLIPSILHCLRDGAPPLLAAGGLNNGCHVASVLALGAAGAVLGTRFLATSESLYTDAQKRALVAAKSESTIRTMAFDRARGTQEWPAGVDGRALYNNTVKDLDEGADIDVVREKFKKGVSEGDPDRMLVWAGTGVGLISDIKDARVRSRPHESAMADCYTGCCFGTIYRYHRKVGRGLKHLHLMLPSNCEGLVSSLRFQVFLSSNIPIVQDTLKLRRQSNSTNVFQLPQQDISHEVSCPSRVYDRISKP